MVEMVKRNSSAGHTFDREPPKRVTQRTLPIETMRIAKRRMTTNSSKGAARC